MVTIFTSICTCTDEKRQKDYYVCRSRGENPIKDIPESFVGELVWYVFDLVNECRSCTEK